MDTHVNLLLGLLALRAGLIDEWQFAEAGRACADDPTASMAEWLAGRGWLSPRDRAEVESRLGETLRDHGDDARTCLDALAEGRARETILALGGLRNGMTTEPTAAGDVDGRWDSTVAHPAVDGGRFQRTRPHPAEGPAGCRDRYTLSSLHARGGIGQIWLARDEALGREVALKELRPERSDDSVSWSRFVDEARITGQLEHPGIVPVYELVRPEGGGTPFYTMRFVRGRMFADAIREHHQRRGKCREEPLGRLSLLNAFLTICHTVAYAHSRGVIHRDLKPQNVVLGDYGEVIVLDWGLAKVLDGPAETEEAPKPSPPIDVMRDATLHGAVLGTPAYMAPEQAEGQLDLVDRRTDVYGLGAILYEILTGQPPFSGSDTEDLLRKVREQEPGPTGRLNRDVPKPLDAICRKAMSKRPEARYGSAQDLAADIQRWIAHEPVSAYRERFGDRLKRSVRRHRTLAAVGLAVALTGAVALGLGGVMLQREREHSEQQRRTLANYDLALLALEEAQAVLAGHPAVVHVQAGPGPGPLVGQIGPDALAILSRDADAKGPSGRGMKKLDEIMRTQSLYVRIRSLLDTVGERVPLMPPPPAAPSQPAPMPAPVAATPPEPPPTERLIEIRRRFEQRFRRQNPGVPVMTGD